MMKKFMFVLAAAALSQAAMAKGVEVSDAWARPTVEGMKQGGAFMKLKNTDKKQNVLVGAEVGKELAGRVELHTHVNDNGVMRMREVKGGIPLPAGKVQELKPGSFHVMYFDLVKPLKAGDSFPMKLKFKDGSSQTVTVNVKDMKATAAPAGHKAPDANPHQQH